MTTNVPSLQAHSAFTGRIGVARVDITPPVGIHAREWGAATHDTAESIHRPLSLTALTMQSRRGGKPLVFVDTDLGFWRNRNLLQDLLRNIRETLSLGSECLMFGMSHTHSSVTLTDPDPSLAGAHLLDAYLERLERATEEAIRDALASAKEAVLEWKYGRCALASNRDFPDPSRAGGRVLCGFNPDVEADDTLLIGRITSSSGDVLAIVVNYACHPTTLAWENRAISPDFVGAMRNLVESVTGAPAVFLQGASGELSPRYQYVGDPEVADRHGRHLGYATLATLEAMDPPGTNLAFDRVVESGAPLAVWRYESVTPTDVLQAIEMKVELPLKNWPTAAELDREQADCTDPVLRERLRRKRDTRINLGDGSTCELQLWVWRVGNAIFAGVSEEAYSNLQTALRKRFSDIPIACINLVNNRIGGYLPPQELYGRDIYQVWRTPFARGSLELIIESMENAITDLVADRIEV